MKNKALYFIGFLGLGLALGYVIFGSEPDNDPVTEVADVHGKWTCSMHPTVDGTEGEKCPLCAMDLVFQGVSGDNELEANQFVMSEDAVALANIATTEVVLGESRNGELSLSGEIKVNRETEAVQTIIFDGRINSLYPDAIGKQVRKGQKIGLVYSPELYSAQDRFLTTASYKGTINAKLYETARNTLGLWKVTDSQIQEILKLGKPMSNFPLYSDVSGTVVEVYASEGKYYKEGEPLFKTANLRTVWAVFDAFEQQLPFLKVGQKVAVHLKAIQGKPILGEIALIEPMVDENTRTVAVRVVLDNKRGKLRPGMFATADVTLEDIDSLLTIPASAVLWTGKRSVVYKKLNADEPKFEMEEVVLGRKLNNHYEVLGGLEDGDIIVTQGAFTIDAAAQLKGKRSMMAIPSETNAEAIKDAIIDDKPNIQLDVKATTGLLSLTNDYMRIKDALVASDVAKTQSSASKLVENLNGFQGDFPQSKKFGEIANAIEKTGNLEQQRHKFNEMSALLIKMNSQTKLVNKTLYHHHCDCVSGGGASWLSYEKTVINPFFGAAMLHCGRVEAVFN